MSTEVYMTPLLELDRAPANSATCGKPGPSQHAPPARLRAIPFAVPAYDILAHPLNRVDVPPAPKRADVSLQLLSRHCVRHGRRSRPMTSGCRIRLHRRCEPPYAPTTGPGVVLDPQRVTRANPNSCEAPLLDTRSLVCSTTYAGNDPVNGSDPSGLCTSFNFTCSWDNGAWIQKARNSATGMVTVTKKEAANLLVDNNWKKTDAKNTINSFDWSHSVYVAVISPDLHWWRYSSNPGPGRLAFGTNNVYTSPNQAVADLDLKESSNNATRFWVLGTDATIPVLYGHVASSASGNGMQIVAPTWGTNVYAEQSVPTSQSWSLVSQYTSVGFPSQAGFTLSYNPLSGCGVDA